MLLPTGAPGGHVRCFKVPNTTDMPTPEPATLLGRLLQISGTRTPRPASWQLAVLVDASGSMRSVWPQIAPAINRIMDKGDGDALLITFDTTARCTSGARLTTSIDKHGGARFSLCNLH